jgi:hypothetical protein
VIQFWRTKTTDWVEWGIEAFHTGGLFSRLMTRVCSVRYNPGCLEDLPHGNNCFAHVSLSQKSGFCLIVLEP